jgi:sec-independent protein translocase protein TatA
MFDIGGPELILIMFVILLLFGPDKMPGLAKGIGKSLREFKKAASSVEEEVRRAIEEEPAKPAPKPAHTVDHQPAGPDRSAAPPPPAAD